MKKTHLKKSEVKQDEFCKTAMQQKQEKFSKAGLTAKTKQDCLAKI